MATAGEIVLFFFGLLVMLVCIFLGSRMGGLGIGFFGGVGVAIYGFGFQMEPGNIPFDVISIIMAVVSAIGCMQVAGGMDYLVHLCSLTLKKYPSGITYVGGILVYVLTALAGTGHVSYSCLPVIAEVAKESGIRPSRALAAAVVGSMIAIVASPISAAVAWMSREMEEEYPFYAHVGYAQILAVMVPSTLIGQIVASAVSSFMGKSLYKDAEFLQRVAVGRCLLKNSLPPDVQEKVDAIRAGISITEALRENEAPEGTGSVVSLRSGVSSQPEGIKTVEDLEGGASPSNVLVVDGPSGVNVVESPGIMDGPSMEGGSGSNITDGEPVQDIEAPHHTFLAKLSVIMFLTGILFVVIYSLLLSDTILPAWDSAHKIVPRNDAIVCMMIATAAAIAQFCNVNIVSVSTSSTFRAGMNGSLCMLGVAWMGNTFITYNLDLIKEVAGELFESQAWLLPVVLFIASCLLYSQASTASALYPMAFQLELSPLVVLASFPAVCGLFILPTYPTLVAAGQMDDTGTSTAGKWIFNHPFIIPGTVCVVVSVALAFAIGTAVA